METKHIKTFEDVETEKSTLKEIPTEYEYPTKLDRIKQSVIIVVGI
jgi:hypothetical protein